MLDWQVKTYQELTKDELYELLRLRTEVFVVEQNCPYQELDNKDQNALHLLGREGKKLVAYARCYTKSDEESAFGRVVISPKARGKGYSHSLIEKSIQIVKENYNPNRIVISAQKHLQKLYETHGFTAQGNPYLEDNIPHIRMILGDIS